jgi:hypothetical protein
MNDRLERVQFGKSYEVPLFDVWYLFIYEDGSWDSGQSNDPDFEKELKSDDLKYVFAVWHGKFRTNLFLMDIEYLLKQFGFKKNESK